MYFMGEKIDIDSIGANEDIKTILKFILQIAGFQEKRINDLREEMYKLFKVV